MWGGAFQLPGVTDIVLKDKYSGDEIGMLDATAKKLDNNEALEGVIEVLFIKNSNIKLYYGLLNSLENDYLMGQNSYSRYMDTTHKLMANDKPTTNDSGTNSDIITFAANERLRSKKNKSNITCFQCGTLL